MTESEVFGRILDRAGRADPYPLYAELRKTPVVALEDGSYVVSTYREIVALLHDPRISSDRRNLDERFAGREPAPPGREPAFIVVDANSGMVLGQRDADHIWHPASVTKLMTAYLTFKAIQSGQLRMTSPVIVSKNALAEPPSKMGFKVGTAITVDNALKMLIVHSANDIAVALAETIGGGSEARFVAQMNAEARRLGMASTHYDNPNGLPMGYEFYDRVAFVNRDRMARYLASGIITPLQARLIGYPKLDRLATGRIDGHAVRASLKLDSSRRTVLYAPTYSSASSLHRTGEAIVRAAAGAGWHTAQRAAIK